MVKTREVRAKGGERLASIDLLRFIAAMMVATMHWGLEIGYERYKIIYELPIVGDLIRSGSFGVDIFFIISGFVIIETASKSSTINFIYARFIRLFPGLLLSMIIVLVIGSYIIQPYETPISSFFHSIFLTYQLLGVQPLTTPLWTLIVEIKFYIGVAITLALLQNLFKSTWGIILLLTSWELIVFLGKYLPSSMETIVQPHLTLNGYYNLFALGICYSLLSKVRLKLTYENLFVYLITLFFIRKVFFNFGYADNLMWYLTCASLMIIFSRKIIFPNRLQLTFYILGLSSYLLYLLHTHLGMFFVLQIQSRLTENIYLVIMISSLLTILVSASLAISFERPVQRYLRTQYEHLRLSQ